MPQPPLLTVAIPIHNGERFIDSLHDTLVSQQFKDHPEVEVVLVNDSSTDGTSEMLGKRFGNWSNARVVAGLFGCLSAARNAGIDAATGRYLYMMDCDDVLVPDRLIPLTRILSESELPFLRFKFEFISENEAKAFKAQHSTEPVSARITTAAKYLVDNNGLLNATTICTSIIKREFLIKHNLRFDPKVTLWEDMPYNYRLFQYLEQIMESDNIVYGYIQYDSSLSHNTNHAHLRSKIPAYYPLMSQLKSLIPIGNTTQDISLRKAIDTTMQILLLRLEVLSIILPILTPRESREYVERLTASGIFPLRTPYPFKKSKQTKLLPSILYRILWYAQRHPALLKILLPLLIRLRNG